MIFDYSDTGYNDIPATVTGMEPIKGSPYTENPVYSDIPLTVTLFGLPTASGEACTKIRRCHIKRASLRAPLPESGSGREIRIVFWRL